MSRSYKPKYENSWALIVGINAYSDFAPLSYACNDADAVEAALISLGFPRDKIVILKDQKATKTAILDAYLALNDRAQNPDDRVIVFFAGHGVTRDGLRGPVGYLVPVDGRNDNLNSLIRWDDLTKNAELIPAKHILFIIDACYSGLAIQRAIPPGTKRFVSENLQRLARQVITAGKADETVADGGGPAGANSIFTGYLIEGLQGSAADSNGVITANALMHYVYQKVGKDERSRQTPHYGHIEGDGDFILLIPDGADFITETQPEKPEPARPTPPGTRTVYSERTGYSDSTRPDFGRNDWSNRLGEERWGRDKGTEIVKAYSWFSIIFEPITDEALSINLSTLLQYLKTVKVANNDPLENFSIPQNSTTTLNSIVLYDDYRGDADLWKRYIRLERDGSLEYADSSCVFGELDGVRHFRYVMIMGLIGQFIYFAKKVLSHAQYNKGGRLLINLVGARDTILADFSKELGDNEQRWLQPFENDPYGRGNNRLNLKCHDPNIQLEYRLILDNVDEANIKAIMDDVVNQLGLAYNHQSEPRCYNFNNSVFPWIQFLSSKANNC